MQLESRNIVKGTIQNIVGITTCKGRLDYVKQSAKSFSDAASTFGFKYLLVDFDCPQNTGQWVKENIPGSYVLEMKPYVGYFHKTKALNAGARYAIEKMQADYLLFFDSDTIIKTGFFSEILLSRDVFMFMRPDKQNEDLSGLLLLSKELFIESGGYDEDIFDWGSDDIEYRLRLYVKHNKRFILIDRNNCISSIPHSDEIRTQYYWSKNKMDSNARNFEITRDMFRSYRNADLLKINNLPDNKNIRLLLGYEECEEQSINTSFYIKRPSVRF
jgi:hypothetical protein